MKDLNEWKSILSSAGVIGPGAVHDVVRVGVRNKTCQSSTIQWVRFDISENANIEKIMVLIGENGGEKPVVGCGYVEFWTKRERKIRENQRVIFIDGKPKTIKQVADMVGITQNGVWTRILNDNDLTAPKQKPGRKRKQHA